MRAFVVAILGASALASCVVHPAAPIAYEGSLVPDYPSVVAEYVQVPGYDAPGTPDALNTAAFMRLRLADEEGARRPVNAVIMGLPGFSSTPSHWLYLGAQLVDKAKSRSCGGQPCRLEVWVLQRRGANLAETEALTRARFEKDPRVAADHYIGPNIMGVQSVRKPSLPAAAMPAGNP